MGNSRGGMEGVSGKGGGRGGEDDGVRVVEGLMAEEVSKAVVVETVG